MCRDCGGQLPRSLAISWGVGAVGGWRFTGKLGPWSRRCTVSHCSLGGWGGGGGGGGRGGAERDVFKKRGVRAHSTGLFTPR